MADHRSSVDFFGTLFRGVSLGSILLVAALGLAITFGVMRVINMAHGEMSIKFVAPDGVRLRRALRNVRTALAVRCPRLACDPRKL